MSLSVRLPKLSICGVPARTCAYPDCRHSPLHGLWRWDAWVRFEGRWYCGAACLEAAARQELEPKLSWRAPLPREHRLPLGLLLLSRGQISVAELNQALAAQRKLGRGRLGEWLLELGFATESQIVAALGQQWACPVLCAKSAPNPACASLVPQHLRHSFRLFPLRYLPTARTLYVAISERLEHTLLSGLGHILDCQIAPCLVSDRKMCALLRPALASEASEFVFEAVADAGEIARILASYVARVGGSAVRYARCGEFLWARVDTSKSHIHLIFRLIPRSPEDLLAEPANLGAEAIKSPPRLPICG